MIFNLNSSKIDNEREQKHRNHSSKDNDVNNPLVSASNFNINVTNLTNSLIVTQNNNNNNHNLPKKIIAPINHKKSKSQGAQKNNNYNSTTVASNFLPKKSGFPLQNYKTSQEFFDSQIRRKN